MSSRLQKMIAAVPASVEPGLLQCVASTLIDTPAPQILTCPRAAGDALCVSGGQIFGRDSSADLAPCAHLQIKPLS